MKAYHPWAWPQPSKRHVFTVTRRGIKAMPEVDISPLRTLRFVSSFFCRPPPPLFDLIRGVCCWPAVVYLYCVRSPRTPTLLPWWGLEIDIDTMIFLGRDGLRALVALIAGWL